MSGPPPTHAPRVAVHVGPTLPPDELERLLPGTARPPAVVGDAIRAIDDGIEVLAIVDGSFEHTLPIWHKELLAALEAGVIVVGSSSMGALRAVELEPFGMIGVGRIVDWVRREEASDADVAVVHGPAPEYRALSEPLVNVRATLEHATAVGALDERQAGVMARSAARQHYAERTWHTILAAAADADPTLRGPEVAEAVRACRVDQKRLDALELCERVAAGDLPRHELAEPLRATAYHERLVAHVRRTRP